MTPSKFTDAATRVAFWLGVTTVFGTSIWYATLNNDLPVSSVGDVRIIGVARPGATVVVEVPYTLDTSRDCAAEIRLSLKVNEVHEAPAFFIDATPQMFKESYRESGGVFRARLTFPNVGGIATLAGPARYRCADNPLHLIKPVTFSYTSKFIIEEPKK